MLVKLPLLPVLRARCSLAGGLQRPRPHSTLSKPAGADRGATKHRNEDHAGGTEVVQRMRHAEQDQPGAHHH